MIINSSKISEKDMISALEIYNYYISNSLSNFEEKKLSILSFKKLYKNIRLKKLPFILAKNESEIVGIAFVNNFRLKSGYRYTHEHSIYINPKLINHGYGTIILSELIKLCRKNKDIKNLIAVIGGSDNLGSINIHKKNGFKYIGTLSKVGYKKNKWVDSVYMQKIL